MRASDSPDGISADKREYKECGVNVKLIFGWIISPSPLPPPRWGEEMFAARDSPSRGGRG